MQGMVQSFRLGHDQQFVILQVFQLLDDLFAALFTAYTLPRGLVVERGNRFIENLAVVLIQRVLDNFGGNLWTDAVCRLPVASVVPARVTFFQELPGRLQRVQGRADEALQERFQHGLSALCPFHGIGGQLHAPGRQFQRAAKRVLAILQGLDGHAAAWPVENGIWSH
jgi:hypothetical protein